MGVLQTVEGPLRRLYRRARVGVKQVAGIEPRVPVRPGEPLEYHGSADCGWSIPAGAVRAGDVVVDVGLGEDISFSTSLQSRTGCTVHGFDPTPKAVAWVRARSPAGFTLHELGVAAHKGRATFHLPNNEAHVSGTLAPAGHTGARTIDVELVALDDVFALTGARDLAVLKLDIEGAEFDLIADPSFARHAPHIGVLCIELHHRWPEHGRAAADAVVARLGALGFECVWAQPESNEEFTFVNRRRAPRA
jgi:FkbM family methyltransferase